MPFYAHTKSTPTGEPAPQNEWEPLFSDNAERNRNEKMNWILHCSAKKHFLLHSHGKQPHIIKKMRGLAVNEPRTMGPRPEERGYSESRRPVNCLSSYFNGAAHSEANAQTTQQNQFAVNFEKFRPDTAKSSLRDKKIKKI